MKTKIFVALLFVAFFSGCKKDDWATDWIGTYDGTAGGVLNRIIVSKVGDKAIKMDLQTNLGNGTYYTFATIGNGTLTSKTHVTVDENGTIVSSPGKTYHFSGSGDLNGIHLSITGQAVNTNDNTDVNYYVFDGDR